MYIYSMYIYIYIYVYLWNHPAHQQWGFLPGDPKQFASHRIRSHLLPLRGHWTGLYRYLWPGAGLGVDAWMCIPRIGSVVYNPCVTHIIPYIGEDIPYITGGKTHVLSGARSPKYSDMSMKISWDTHDITDWMGIWWNLTTNGHLGLSETELILRYTSIWWNGAPNFQTLS